MYLTGFADEAGACIDTQIKATQTLGWSNIEMRNVGVGDETKNLTEISDAAFDIVAAKLDDAGVTVNCFGSAIANWGKLITEPFDSSLEESRRAIPRMKRLGSTFVRMMSFKHDLESDPFDDDAQGFEERCRRLRELVAMFAGEGLTCVHENCMNYGGMGYLFTQRLVENVPGLKLVYDTGNPVFTDDRTKPAPYPKQNSWEFYSHVKEHIAYVHIKDGTWPVGAEKPTSTFTYAGEGQGDVRAIVKDLLDSGYEGGFSMEPHLAVVFHDESVQAKDEVRYSNYIEYGRRFEQLLSDIGHPVR